MSDKRSLLLILVCSVLVLTWVYHLYDKSSYSRKTKEVLVKDTAAIAEAVSDSLKKIFSDTLDGLNAAKPNIDSAGNNMNNDLRIQISEIDSLKYEVDILLKRQNLTAADWNKARDKIGKLQGKIASFHKADSSFTDIRIRLNNIVTQLNAELYALRNRKQISSSENPSPVKKINESPTFVISDIKFSALYQGRDQKTAETNLANEAEKLVASFMVRNNTADIDNAEIIIVITDPSGKTINPEVWDAGSFETKAEGRKAYTKRLRFEYKKSEAKRLSYSLQPDQFEKGTYKLNFYHTGIRIGGADLKLN